MLRLTDLNPIWDIKNDRRMSVTFDCPKCRMHWITVPIPPSEKAWQMHGDSFENLTLSPSIAHKCYDADWNSKDGQSGRVCESHFFVVNGAINMCE